MSPPRRSAPSLPLVLGLGAVLAVGLLLGAWSGPALAVGLRRLLPKHSSHADQAHDADTTWYISQMHPWIVQPGPGQCPICGMDLTPIDPARFGGQLAIDPVFTQNLGIRTVPVLRERPVLRLRSPGTVVVDPTRVQTVQIRSAGWIESLGVGTVGERVAAGQTLLQLRSGELQIAQREWLRAQDGPREAEAAARLRFLGFTDLDSLRRDGPSEVAAIVAAIDGVVLERPIKAGQRVEVGTLALRLADLEQIWVELPVYQSQLDAIAPGLPAEVVLVDGSVHEGHVALVEPLLSEHSRSARARIVLDNADGRLWPGMYATVTIARELAEALLVPRAAVVDSGLRQLVFVSRGRGRFEPREVELGPLDASGRVVIRSGLEAGEAVVVSGQFLLDSENRLQEALARMILGDLASQPSPSAPADTAAQHTEEADAAPLGQLLEAYWPLHRALYQDDEAAARDAIAGLDHALAEWSAADAHLNHRLPAAEDLREAITAMQDATDLRSLRHAFGAASIALRDLLRAGGVPRGGDPALMVCGMADAPERGVWLQPDDTEVHNPFFGFADALHGECGDSDPLRGEL